MDWFGILFLTSFINGQGELHAQREINKSSKIALSDVLGDWYSNESLDGKISFKKIGTFLVEIDGIKHGVGNYGFVVEGDSMNVKGLAINWPPYDCTLHMLNKNCLQIEFYQFFTIKNNSVVYLRK